MTEQERQAWFMLGVFIVTLTAYIAFILTIRFDLSAMAVFALAGIAGIRISKHRRGEITYDERDRQIERQALLSSMRAFFVLIVLLPLAVGVACGWNAPVRLWVVVQAIWAISLAICGLKALLTIMLYHRRSNA
jgi:uncharacterized membrane protein